MKKVLAYLLTIIMVLSACSAWAEPAEEAAEETPQIEYSYDELTVAATTPMTGQFFTSMWGNGSSDMDVRAMIHGYNLVEWDTEAGVFLPDSSVVTGSAVQQEANGDITFILMLYEDLYYSDGTPITAWDYAFSMLLTMAPELKELGANVRTPDYIAGYNNYITGRTKELSGVKVVGDHILNITINGNYLPFFYELGLLDCIPYPISVIAPGVKVADDGNGVYLTNADGGDDPVFTAELLKGTLLDEATGYCTHPSVTSGPYVLKSFADGKADFEINPNYKGDAKGKKPTIPTVHFVTMTTDKMSEALADGSVTVLNKVSNAETVNECMDVASKQELLTPANYFRTGLSFINFNTASEPLNDLAVRQAIAYIADREAITNETLGTYGLRSNGYYGMGQWMYLLLNGTAQYPVEEPGENASQKEKNEYEKAIEDWQKLKLDDIEGYDRDVEKGIALLESAGWNLNENGDAYEAGEGKIRYKKTDAGLVPLELTLAYGDGSAAGAALAGTLVKSLAEAGIGLKAEAIDSKEVLSEYYGNSESAYDMLFLATNFDVLYDPAQSFATTEDGHHVWRSSGLEDDELYRLAVRMRQTEAGDLLEYCTRWLAFEQKFMEDLPLLPVYSNVYFDFYPLVLHDYAIGDNISWPQAIVDSYLAEYVPEVEGEEEIAEP